MACTCSAYSLSCLGNGSRWVAGTLGSMVVRPVLRIKVNEQEQQK